MPLLNPKIGRGLSAAISLNLVLDGLSLVERTQASPLNSRDVDKHIFATAACNPSVRTTEWSAIYRDALDRHQVLAEST
jgi:hypothetical protein